MAKVTILFKKLHSEAQAPIRAHDGDAGWDVTNVGYALSRNYITYRTGLAFAIPKGYWMMAVPRSSIYKTGLIMSNSLGVIDSGFRGEVKAVFYCCCKDVNSYLLGNRIMQLIVQPALTTDVEFVEVDELPESEDGRGEGGFGSTGK